ncbi:hypothetical protein [Cellulosimicrobium sp. TH-20]|uniref:hypothetical protein n=1 Tax=Cellulosimicrobium sp. TH-20 TaxID=1980001 RepID=UPI0012F845FA|nr:hypothetical protein [Cellulosimicrobium sp. TH-20]
MRAAESTPETRHATNVYIASLCHAGWSLRSIANAFGTTVQAVNARKSRVSVEEVMSDVPRPGDGSETMRRRRQVGDSEREEILELQALVQPRARSMPVHSPPVLANYKLAWMYQRELAAGSTLPDLARDLGTSVERIVAHLYRFGFHAMKRAQGPAGSRCSESAPPPRTSAPERSGRRRA